MPPGLVLCLASDEVRTAQVPNVAERVFGVVQDDQGKRVADDHFHDGPLPSFLVDVPAELKTLDTDERILNFAWRDLVQLDDLLCGLGLTSSCATQSRNATSAFLTRRERWSNAQVSPGSGKPRANRPPGNRRAAMSWRPCCQARRAASRRGSAAARCSRGAWRSRGR